MLSAHHRSHGWSWDLTLTILFWRKSLLDKFLAEGQRGYNSLRLIYKRKYVECKSLDGFMKSKRKNELSL
jgi:hypothetical protein